MKLTSYSEAISYLESFVARVQMRYDKKYLKEHDPLDRMRILLSLLENPQEKLKSVLVGGTSGKGSTSYLIAHIFKTSGYKTGLMIKPHLEKINERIQINETPIPDGEFVAYLNRLAPVIDQMSTLPVGEPSYFEILTAMGFLYFAKHKVDIAIVEVGMGGEFDATNTLYPLIAVITNVSLDHTEYLGKTVQKIARTKSGIIKGWGPAAPLLPVSARSRLASSNELRAAGNPSSRVTPSFPVVTGAKQPSVVKIIEKRCLEVGAKLYKSQRNFRYKIKKEDASGSIFVFREKGYISPLLHLSLIGEYQVENAALALEVVLRLAQFGFPLSDHDIMKAFETASFPGRFEVVSLQVPILRLPPSYAKASEGKSSRVTPHGSAQLILDGAHNAEKMRAFLATLKKLYKQQKKIFILAFKKDKNIAPMISQILRVAEGIVVTEFHATTDFAKSGYSATPITEIENIIVRARSGEASKSKNRVPIYYQEYLQDALEKAEKVVKGEKDSVIVVTGSLYLVGEVKRFIALAKIR